MLTGCTLVGGAGGFTSSSPIPLALPDAQPIAEAPSAMGNMEAYEEFGRTYEVLPTSYEYNAEGLASWYGEPFHGRQTSNGEVYDMYAFTAAHRTLPLPTYVQVTNLSNNRSVVLRVNDRGPFIDPEDRIIDVSYAAAEMLGMLEPGTAPVAVRALEPWQSRVR